MNKTKLLLIDKDGTLVVPKSGSKFVQKPWDQMPIKGVEAKLNQYQQNGWHIVVISNQGGVEARHKTLADTILEMEFCLELFPQIAECFFCPDYQGRDCYRVWRSDFIQYDSFGSDAQELGIDMLFRKPNPGMLKLAVFTHSSDELLYVGDSDELLYVGDRDEDEKAANAANIPFMWASDFLK